MCCQRFLTLSTQASTSRKSADNECCLTFRWMVNFSSASWDLAVIYTGSQSNFSCPECVHVESNKGAKWLLIYSFTRSAAWFNSYQHHYDMVYVPDDDILQTSSAVDSLFEIHAKYGLAVSQPMLCSWLESHSSSWDVIKWPTTVLRYTNFVEIMVPVFNMSVFNGTVIDTLKYATTGEICFAALWRTTVLSCCLEEHFCRYFSLVSILHNTAYP